MLSVATDVLSLNIQKNLNTATNAVSEALERMSTGYKINCAKDDAAGLYIATKMSSQIRGLQQAQKNTQDGISLLQTAEGAFNNMKDILNRLRDLSVQAANGIYDEAARKAMQQEADQLTKQLIQIKDGTNFNGLSLFNNPPKAIENSSVTSVFGLSGGTESIKSEVSGLIFHTTQKLIFLF